MFQTARFRCQIPRSKFLLSRRIQGLYRGVRNFRGRGKETEGRITGLLTENGTFTTEDSALGTTRNLLTRNRYAYTSNNPVNYNDPSGHSWWSKAKSAAKKVVSTAKKAVNTVVKTAKKVVKTVVNGVKTAASWVKSKVTQAKQTVQKKYEQTKQAVSKTYNKVKSKGSRLVKQVSQGGKKLIKAAGKTYTSFKSYASERTKEIRATIKRELCSKENLRIQQIKTGITVVGLSVFTVANMQLQQLKEKFPNIQIEYTGTLKDSIQLGAGLATISGGLGLTILGGGGTIISGGLAAGVSIPVVVAGATTVTAGTVIVSDALANMVDVKVSKSESSAEKAQKAMENGEPRENHKIVTDSKERIPTRGEKNSSVDILNPDGTVKQRRYYGPDGKAQKDIDYNHSDNGTHTFPHEHEWEWNGDISKRKPGK